MQIYSKNKKVVKKLDKQPKVVYTPYHGSTKHKG